MDRNKSVTNEDVNCSSEFIKSKQQVYELLGKWGFESCQEAFWSNFRFQYHNHSFTKYFLNRKQHHNVLFETHE